MDKGTMGHFDKGTKGQMVKGENGVIMSSEHGGRDRPRPYRRVLYRRGIPEGLRKVKIGGGRGIVGV